MAFYEDVKGEIEKIFRDKWEERDGTIVPESEDLKQGNDGVNLDAVVLYADMADSTNLVMSKSNHFAAEIYKTFLLAACRCISKNNGAITAFDGDRVMAVFIGDMKRTNAVTTAMNIRYFVDNSINPYLENIYKVSYKLNFCIGIDLSKLFVAKTGIRKFNDLVWVGNAANLAAKMAAFNEQPYNIFITHPVYEKMAEKVKYVEVSGSKVDMWEKRNWEKFNKTCYRTTYSLKPL